MPENFIRELQLLSPKILPEAGMRKRKLARQICRDAVGRNRDIAVAEKLKRGRDEIVRVTVDRRIIPDKAVGIGRGHLNSSSHLGM